MRRIVRRRATIEPKPVFRGEAVTVCISVKVPSQKRFILVSDRMISSDEASVESADKMAAIATVPNPPWMAMFAGHAPRVQPLIEQIRAHLNGYDLADVIAACEAGYRVELQKRIESEILLPFGVTRDEFIKQGREWFGEVRFGAIVEQMTATDLGVDLLVSGFDSAGEQHMFEMAANGVVTRVDQLPFHAVGNGRWMALATLYPLSSSSFHYAEDINEAIYRVLCAKFAAESAPGVGRDSMVFVFSANGLEGMMMSDETDEVRQLWKELECPPVPEGAVQALKESVLWIANAPGREIVEESRADGRKSSS